MVNPWKKLKKPIFALAPMEDVTDTVFRRIVASASRPDIFFTEFTSVDGMLSKGADKVMQRLIFSEKERPIIGQIWGSDPEKFFKAAQIIKKMGFDGVDINMGCPEKSVVKRGCCSALILNHDLAGKIIQSVKDGAGGLPISIKTRIGFRDIETEDWVSFLISQNIDALIIHGRTVREKSQVPAHWDEIGKAVKIRNKMGVDTLILGNGDIISAEDALEKIKEYKVDGVMIGRGVFKDYWIFNKNSKKYQPTLEEKLKILLMHAEMFDKQWGKKKNFAILRKFFKSYVADFPGASGLRVKLTQTNSVEEVQNILKGLV